MTPYLLYLVAERVTTPMSRQIPKWSDADGVFNIMVDIPLRGIL
jgi:hypothetical protein